MKVAFKKGSSVFLKETTLRPLKSDEIRLKVVACGICGTDLLDNPEEAGKVLPFGHEMAGTIVEIGGYAPNLKLGQKVVIESASACGRCTNCRNARQELCTDKQSFFYLNHFGFAEETIVPAISAIPCGELEPEITCLSEPLGVAIDIVRLSDIKPTSNVLIMGQGPIGLMALSLAKRAGVRRVFVSDFKSRTSRMELALRLGADDFIDPSVTALKDFDFNCEIDRILVTSPPNTITNAVGIAANGGIISFIGLGFGKEGLCSFDGNEFHFKKLQLRASFASPALYTPLALQYLREGVVKGEDLISHRFPLNKIDEALKVAKDDPKAIKVMVLP